MENTKASQAEKPKLSLGRLKHALSIFRYLLPYKGLFFLGMLCLFCSALLGFGFPYLLGELVGQGAAGEAKSIINQTLKLLVLLIIGQVIFSYGRTVFLAIVSEKSVADLRSDIYARIISLPLPFFEERRVGELTSRISADAAQMQEGIRGIIPEFMRQIVTLLVGIAYIFYLSTKLSLIMLSTLPVLILISFLLSRSIKKLSRNATDKLGEGNTVVEETFQGITVVKAFTNELLEHMKYKSLMDNVAQLGIRVAILRGFLVTLILLIIFGGLTLVIWQSSIMLSAKEMNINDFVTFLFITVMLVGSLGSLGNFYTRLVQIVGSTERIRDILNMPSEIDFNQYAAGHREKQLKLSGALAFKNVAFSYPSRKDIEVLNDINFELEKGKKIALVGASGAGKSTIIQLLLGFYPIDNGEIELDGKAYGSYPLETIRSNIALVPQEVLLFGGSIAENIAYGDPTASRTEIESAAKQANAYDFVSDFPEGFDTIVGERGIKLSGGQKQRIAIARAILKDPSILLLDEATSSLDAESEQVVQDALDKLMENKTTIIIAHRLSTIKGVDEILVMDKGKIVERGHHLNLSSIENGYYSNLLKLQFEEAEV